MYVYDYICINKSPQTSAPVLLKAMDEVDRPARGTSERAEAQKRVGPDRPHEPQSKPG